MKRLGFLLAALLMAGGVWAQETDADAAYTAPEPNEEVVMVEQADEGTVAAEDTADFPEGFKFKPFPLVSYNSDLGLGYGVSLSIFNYGGTSDSYDLKIYTEYMGYTGGQMDPDIRFDIPNIWIGDQPFRLTGFAEYKHARFQPFYGTNNTDVENSYDTNTHDKYYYMYDMVNPYIYFTITTPLVWGRKKGFDKEVGFALGGYIESYSFTNSYTKDDSGNPIYQNSKLVETQPYGFEGGLATSVYTGFTFDSRDYIPNPHKGTYNEVIAEFSFGNYNYQRLSIVHTAYFQPFKTYDNLVLAERLWVDNLFGTPPFFKQNKIGGTQTKDGFGSADTQRGVDMFRHVGNFKFLWTPELRWRFVDFGPFLGDTWHLELTPFVDIGNTFETINDFNLSDIYVAYGTGLKVLWGEDFIIAFDFGFWQGEMGTYIGFDHQF